MRSVPIRSSALAILVLALSLSSTPSRAEVEPDDRPTLEVETIDGDSVSLEQWRGKVVLVDFWATWCEPCRDSLPFYDSLAADHDDFRILAVSVDENQSTVTDFLDQRDLSIDVAIDGDHEIAAQFEPPTMPTCYLIGPKGSVQFVHSGFEEGDEELLTEKVESLLGETGEDSEQ